MTWSTAVIVLVVLIVLWASRKSKQAKAKNLAKKSNADIKKTLEENYPEYEPKELRSVKGIDYDFYEKNSEAMGLEGFSIKGDFQDLEHNRNFPKQQTVLRFMVSQDRTIMAALYHLPVQFINKLLLWSMGNFSKFRTIDLETEFTDRHFVMTTTAALLLSDPPEFRRNLLPASTPVKELVRLHRESVAAYLDRNHDVETVRFNNLNDIMDSQARGAELSRIHRKNMGGLTKEELTALMPSHIHTTDPKMANELEAAFDNERNSVIKPDERGSPFED